MTLVTAMTAEQSLAWMAENGITQVRVEWPDINGLGRGKIIPVQNFAAACKNGIQFSNAALSFDILSVPAAVAGQDTQLGAATGFRNVKAVPDLTTLRKWPNEAGVAWCLCNVESMEGQPVESSPRSFALKVGTQLNAQGYTARIAPELEFYIAEQNRTIMESGSPCYGMETLVQFDAAMREALSAVSAFWQLEAWHHEHGPGQFEVNVSPAPYLDAADALHGVRIAVREAVAKQGLRASFMAKPYNDLNGSACQLNLSLQDDSGENLFAAVDGSNGNSCGPSELCLHFVAGVLDHLDELAAVFLPNGNSYRRVVPGRFAPVTRAWGMDNRTAAVRVIAQRPETTRVELRVPGADICAHLALPAFVAAGLDGIDRKLDPGPPAEGNLDAGNFPRVVTDWAAALQLFGGSQWVRQVFGPELRDTFLAVKHQEFARFRNWVSDFDTREYGQQF